MFVADTLLVDLDTRHGQDPVFFLQPAGIELAVRNDPQEDYSQGHREQPCEQEHDLPWLDGRTMLRRTNCNAVCHQAAEDLAPAVEAEPYIDSTILFLLGVPL